MTDKSKIPTVILNQGADKSKIPTVILNQGNAIPEGAIIITKKKKKKKKIFGDTPYPQYGQKSKPKIKAFKGGGRAYGKNS